MGLAARKRRRLADAREDMSPSDGLRSRERNRVIREPDSLCAPLRTRAPRQVFGLMGFGKLRLPPTWRCFPGLEAQCMSRRSFPITAAGQPRNARRGHSAVTGFPFQLATINGASTVD
jgi:hypothetical protein